jgi:hypothetical protein
MVDVEIYFAKRTRNRLGTLFVLFIGICQWLYSFCLTYFVLSAHSEAAGSPIQPLRPEIEIDFSTRVTALRTTFLLALIVLSWFSCYSFMFGYRWGYYYTWAWGIFLLAVGLYAHWTNHGAFEDFLATGSLRQTTGLVVAVLAGATLVLLPLPPTRRRFFQDSWLSFREG